MVHLLVRGLKLCATVARHWVEATFRLLCGDLVLDLQVEAGALCSGWVFIIDC